MDRGVALDVEGKSEMAEAEIACLRCGNPGLPGPDGACARCGAPLDPLQTAPLPRPAVVLPETDPDKLVKRGGAVPVLAAAAAAALALAGGGAWFASRRPASAARRPDTASASLQSSTAAPAPLRRPIAVAAAEADATYAEPPRNAAAADEPRRATNESPGPRAAPQPGSRRTGLEIGSASVVDPPRAPPAPEPSVPARPSAAPPVQPASVTPAPAVAGTLPLPPPPPDTQLIEDAPMFALEGFQKPRMVEPGCVQAALRLPHDLTARLKGPVTVRFAVGVDGKVGLFQVVSDVPDRRVTDAIWSAIRSCRFLPGADAQGRKTRLWVVMPFRFER
jgi:TonB family protein